MLPGGTGLAATALLPDIVGKDDNVGVRITAVDGGTVVVVGERVGTVTALMAGVEGRDDTGGVRPTVKRGTVVFDGTDSALDGVSTAVEGGSSDATGPAAAAATVVTEGTETQTDTVVHDGSEGENALTGTVLDGGAASGTYTDVDGVTVALGTVVDGSIVTVALRGTGVVGGSLPRCGDVVMVPGGGSPASP